MARIQMEPIRLQAKATGQGMRVEVLDAAGLFDRAGQLLSAKKYREAVTAYQNLLEQFPGSRFASPALYNAGLAHEWQGEFGRAAERYRELIRRFGATKEAIDAAYRLGGCHAELRNWPASAQVFGELAQRKDLGASDRVEALSRQGLAQFRLGDARACRSTLQQAIDFYKRVETVERLETDFFVAMARYYLGALPHVEFRNLKVDAGPAMAKTLDDKARLLLAAQASYIEAIKAKNPYWATAAGFQIGSLYREFYVVLLTTVPDFSKQAERNSKAAAIPLQQAQDQLIEVYLEEVHKAVKPLLNKAIQVFEKNVLVGERVGVESEWVGKSRHQVDDLKHLLSLPPSEAVRLVKQGQVPPEDQPAAPAQGTSPGQGPVRPADKPPEGDDEPGRVIL
jgi:TolA-binding protein